MGQSKIDTPEKLPT